MSVAVEGQGGVDQRVVESFIEYFRRYEKDALGQWATSDETNFAVDTSELARYDSNLYWDVLERPDAIREAAEVALQRVELPADVDREGATVKFGDLTNDARTFDVGEYRTDEVGQLIAVRGQANKITQVRGRIKTAVFVCQRCGVPREVDQQGDEALDTPHECTECERQGPFDVDLSRSVDTDVQHARIQLPPEKAAGASERHFDVVLEGDQVESFQPGDRVHVTTVLRGHVDPSDNRDFDLTGEVESAKVRETDFDDIDPAEHADRIDEVAAGDLYDSIVNSIAPTIRGLDDIKLAMGLQLFGGVQKDLPDNRSERGVSHLMLVGDPGTAKSELVAYVNMIAPRSVYTDGKGSSSAGLTASAVRDDFGPGGEWTIEGGALVKAHRGVCCIDELDKMDAEDRDAMHTALAQQFVPVSKAGITTTLPARTTVLAAANPKHSRFDPYEPTASQIDLSPTLISRFDLIFTLTDDNDEETDREIISHKADAQELGQRLAAGKDIPDELLNEHEPEVSPEVFRAWVARARQLVPVYRDEAKRKLEEEFATFRQANDHDTDEEVVPVTFRKQDAITRLAEASARARLSEWIEIEDVERALTLVRQSLDDVGIDPETGEYDADVIETGESTTQRNKVKQVAAVVADLEGEATEGAPAESVLNVLTEDPDVGQGKAEHYINKAKDAGAIYEPTRGYYRAT